MLCKILTLILALAIAQVNSQSLEKEFPHISAKQLNTFRKSFKIFDTNNDGLISPAEFGNVMRSIGLQVPPNLADALKLWDSDGDGYINIQEMIQQQAGISENDKTRSSFKIFDADKDGFISRAELKKVMDSLGLHLTSFQLGAVFLQFDKDFDGKLNFNEFKAVTNAAKKKK